MPIVERTCFLGSTGLGRCHLGNIAVQLRDCTVHPRGIAYLPRGITCLGIDGLRGPKPCRAPGCLGKDSILCLKECYPPGKPRNYLPGRSHSLLVKECYLPGKSENCLSGRTQSLPVKECYLPGKHGNCLPGR